MQKNLVTLLFTMMAQFSDGKLYERSGERLTDVPDNIPNDTTRVQLSFNHIQIVRQHAFSHLSLCVRLNLRENMIHEKQRDAFYGLKSLEILILSYNRLKVLKYGTFTSLTSLQELDLSFNNLETVEHMAFKVIPHSLVLHLRNNPIQCDARVCWLKRAERDGSIVWSLSSWWPDKKTWPDCFNSWNSDFCFERGWDDSGGFDKETVIRNVIIGVVVVVAAMIALAFLFNYIRGRKYRRSVQRSQVSETRANQQRQRFIRVLLAETGSPLLSAPPALPTRTNHEPEGEPTLEPGLEVHPSTSDNPPSYKEISPDPPPDYSSLNFNK